MAEYFNLVFYGVLGAGVVVVLIAFCVGALYGQWHERRRHEGGD